MKEELVKILSSYIDKIDKTEITMEEFKADFDSAFEEAMIPYIHPYARDEFKNDFQSIDGGWASK